MRKFVCNDCGGVSYSSAALENQKHPECTHCGHLACKEVPMTTEDLTLTSQSSDGVLKSAASNKILYQCDPERNSTAKFTEELRQRINNAGFNDEFKQQIKSAQKEEGRKQQHEERIRNKKNW